MGLRRSLYFMGFGAGLMYFYDPEQGRRRRALLRDRWTRLRNDTQDLWKEGPRDLQNRARGVREHPASLISAPGEMGDMRGQWTPGVRLAAMLAGSGLTLYGMTQRGLRGTVATLAGLNLVSRGAINKSMSGLMGMSRDQVSRGGGSGQNQGGDGDYNEDRVNQAFTAQPGASPSARHQPKAQSSGAPGDGQGRTDKVDRTGVYPASEMMDAPDDAQAQGMASWGQGERGAAGYADSGRSELDLGDVEGMGQSASFSSKGDLDDTADVTDTDDPGESGERGESTGFDSVQPDNLLGKE